ncbi:hypothetical protein HHK36_014550 [Tetracentron sinense]|uniref:RING-type E3 ubiquitin transferase n=1 Tax=Tetracentron sinense TaxID=13715 RepID=A0A834Z5R2_TETSI|nr:hypothetical protein HHK36_014550 [Tetracentron sinense]
MSSTGISGSGSQRYFCYQCERTVSITPSRSSDLLCPNCNGGFLEEEEHQHQHEDPNPNPNPNPFFAFSDNLSGFPSISPGLGGGFPLVFSTSRTIDFQNPSDFSGLFGGPQRSAPGSLQDPDVFNPFNFLQNYIQTLRAGGADIQFVVENNPSDQGFRLPANLGDYFIGPGLEQLIQQLAENDPNRHGTPPASKSAVEGLPNIKVTAELLASDSSQCAVCKDTFELDAEVKQMPCKHIYHPDCILPWLDLHNSCPVCRYELPTDDPDYEHRDRGTPVPGNPVAAAAAAAAAAALGNSGGAGGAGASQENPLTPRTAERRFRISLPWPFRAFGSPAETSNSGVGTNNNNNDGESNSGGRGNPDFGSETRQEDLD